MSKRKLEKGKDSIDETQAKRQKKDKEDKKYEDDSESKERDRPKKIKIGDKLLKYVEMNEDAISLSSDVNGLCTGELGSCSAVAVIGSGDVMSLMHIATIKDGHTKIILDEKSRIEKISGVKPARVVIGFNKKKYEEELGLDDKVDKKENRETAKKSTVSAQATKKELMTPTDIYKNWLPHNQNIYLSHLKGLQELDTKLGGKLELVHAINGAFAVYRGGSFSVEISTKEIDAARDRVEKKERSQIASEATEPDSESSSGFFVASGSAALPIGAAADEEDKEKSPGIKPKAADKLGAEKNYFKSKS
jgi:hypothetical protein